MTSMSRLWIAAALVLAWGCESKPSPLDGASAPPDASLGSDAADGGALLEDATAGDTDAAPAPEDAAPSAEDAAPPPVDGGADDASTPDASTTPTEPSPGCGAGAARYRPGRTTVGQLSHDGLARTFRVHVPPSHDGTTPLPLLLMFHGGGGSGRQFEEASSGMSPIADREGFIAVYPDGTGRIQTWNGGGCCGSAVMDGVDDVGFTRALLDHLEAELCIDRLRVHASGMSNGAIMSHRLACELADRIASVAPIAGTEMSPTCTPSRRVAVMHVHGSADGHVPFAGGMGCGPAGVAFTSVPATMERRRVLNGCATTTSTTFQQGDGTCQGYDGCADGADVVLCTIAGGGHSWPGGAPPAGLVACPGNGGQSSTFIASEVVWSFLSAHPRMP